MPASTRSRSRRERDRDEPEQRLRRNREAQEAAYEAARVVLGRAAARRDTQWRQAAQANRRRTRIVLGAPAILGLVVLLIGVLVPALLIVGSALVVLWALFATVVWAGSASSLLAAIGGASPADAVASGALRPIDSERLVDLSEGLCSTLGLPGPELRVLPDMAPNAIAVGRRHDDSVLVVTAGLVELLSRIELEAVVAHELSHIKRLDVSCAALLSTSLGRALAALGGERLVLWLVGPDREIRADLAAVSTTRYPPGLIGVLEEISRYGDCRPASLPEAVLEQTALTWLVPFPRRAGERPGSEPPGTLGERLDVLREL